MRCFFSTACAATSLGDISGARACLGLPWCSPSPKLCSLRELHDVSVVACLVRPGLRLMESVRLRGTSIFVRDPRARRQGAQGSRRIAAGRADRPLQAHLATRRALQARLHADRHGLSSDDSPAKYPNAASNGPGSTSSSPIVRASIRAPASGAGITLTRALCSVR